MPISNTNEKASTNPRIHIVEEVEMPMVETHHVDLLGSKENSFAKSGITQNMRRKGEINKRIRLWHLRIRNLGSEISQSSDDMLYQKILDQIDNLLTNEYDWEEIGYEKPHPEDMDSAKSIMSEFISSISSAGYTIFALDTPSISNGENGGATIEWRENERSLYFDINHQSAKRTKVWKEGKNTIVRTKKLRSSDYVKVWKWIIDE